jgi:glutamyl-tRNA reductase
MNPLPNESYESWSNRVEMFERGRALQKLAQGDPVEIVMEEMGRRIMEKLLHPIFKAIRESSTSTNYNPVKSKQEYDAKMRYHAPVADHVEGNLFDKLD